MDALTLQFPPSTQLSDDQYYELCRANRDLRIERSAHGELMQEYIDNGARLGWLINRKDKQVEVYRPEQATEILQAP